MLFGQRLGEAALCQALDETMDVKGDGRSFSDHYNHTDAE